ncbi:hypothetical protein EOA22_34825, partial [Mesorhizobium sp. M7A.F.Ca.US.014.04.1.1]
VLTPPIRPKKVGRKGSFIGPVLMALLVAIWREWLREVELADETAADSAAEIESGPQIEVLPESNAAKKASA